MIRHSETSSDSPTGFICSSASDLDAFGQTCQSSSPSTVGCTPNACKNKSKLFRQIDLQELFQTSRRQFVGVAYSILHNRDEAEDAVQDAFVSASRNLRDFEGRAALRTWLTRIVINAALMTRRKRRTWQFDCFPNRSDLEAASWLEAIPSADRDPEALLVRADAFRIVKAIINKLHPNQRQAITLCYLHEISRKEICEAFDINRETLKARLSRAMEQITRNLPPSLTSLPKTRRPAELLVARRARGDQ